MQSEFLKMRYSKWILFVTAFIPVFAVGMMLLLPIQGIFGFELYATKCLQSLYLTQNWFIVLAALYFGEEYKTGTLRTTLMACPDRLRFLKEKTGCFFVWITLVLCIAIGCCMLVFFMRHEEIWGGISKDNVKNLASDIASNLGYGMTESMGIVLIARAVQVILSVLELAGIMVALTMLFRSGILSMAVGIALLMGAGHMLLQLGGAFRYLPGICTMNAFYLSPMPGFLNIKEGLICQGVWCVLLLMVAGFVFQRRSVR